jgi:hypothetical protein
MTQVLRNEKKTEETAEADRQTFVYWMNSANHIPMHHLYHIYHTTITEENET